ncbi:hypothetical protein EDC01DRAFT_760918 [Geopyxis carbonaria]|nr:hypothetical protein EDC01DRAFT_760918 [Geopyxis carbonaria]
MHVSPHHSATPAVPPPRHHGHSTTSHNISLHSTPPTPPPPPPPLLIKPQGSAHAPSIPFLSHAPAIPVPLSLLPVPTLAIATSGAQAKPGAALHRLSLRLCHLPPSPPTPAPTQQQRQQRQRHFVPPVTSTARARSGGYASLASGTVHGRTPYATFACIYSSSDQSYHNLQSHARCKRRSAEAPLQAAALPP